MGPGHSFFLESLPIRHAGFPSYNQSKCSADQGALKSVFKGQYSGISEMLIWNHGFN